MWYVSVCCIKQISSVFGYVVHLKEHLTIVFYHTTIYLENDILLTSLISYSVCEDKMSYENLTHYLTCQNTLSLSSPMLPATDRDAHPILHETATRRGELPPHKQDSPQGHQRYLVPLSHKKSKKSSRFRSLFTL